MKNDHTVVKALKVRQQCQSNHDHNFIYLNLPNKKEFVDVENGIIGALQALQLKDNFSYIIDKNNDYTYPDFHEQLDNLNDKIMSIDFKFEELSWFESISKVFKSKSELIVSYDACESITLVVKVFIPKYYSELEKIEIGVKAISTIFNRTEPYVVETSGSYSVLPSK